MSDSLPFSRIAVDPLGALGESWRRIRDQYWLFVGISVFGTLLAGAAPLGLLLGPMMCGIYASFLEKWRGRRVGFEAVFSGFKSPVLGQSLIAGVAMMVLTMALIVPMIVVGFLVAIGMGAVTGGRHEPPAALLIAVLGGVALLFVFVILLVHTLLLFAFPLIVDRKLPALEALRLSTRAGFAHVGGLLGLTFVTMLLALLGACLCYVGALLVMPVSLGAQMVVYERIFGLAPEPSAGT